jgi:hypothetical protein
LDQSGIQEVLADHVAVAFDDAAEEVLVGR